MRLDIVYLIWNMESRYLESEVGGLSSTGKSFRVVRACVRAVCMSSEFGAKIYGLPLPLFPFPAGGFPFSLGVWQQGEETRDKRQETREKREERQVISIEMYIDLVSLVHSHPPFHNISSTSGQPH